MFTDLLCLYTPFIASAPSLFAGHFQCLRLGVPRIGTYCFHVLHVVFQVGCLPMILISTSCAGHV